MRIISTPGSKNLGLRRHHPNAIGTYGDQPNIQQMVQDTRQITGR